MNMDVMRLKDAIMEARILAGAEMERLCNEKNYLEASIFQSVRDNMAANIQMLEAYEICKENERRRGKEPGGEGMTLDEAITNAEEREQIPNISLQRL